MSTKRRVPHSSFFPSLLLCQDNENHWKLGWNLEAPQAKRTYSCPLQQPRTQICPTRTHGYPKNSYITFFWPTSWLYLLLLILFFFSLSLLLLIVLISSSVSRFNNVCLWLFNEGSSEHDPTKYKAPMFSMGMRHKLANPSCSPGPKYSMHPKITRKGHDGTPAFSMYKRRKDPRLAQTPGPGQKNSHLL